MARKLLLLVQFIPLSVFLAIVRWTDEMGPNWKLAFVIGGCLAVIEFALLFIKKKVFDRLIMAVNLFLFVGGVGFLFDIHPILNLYDNLMQSALFVSILLVGLVTTFFSVYGFIAVNHPNKQLVRSRSLYLVVTSLFAFALSLFFRGDMLLGGTLPFIGLLVIRRILSQNMNEKSISYEGHK